MALKWILLLLQTTAIATGNFTSYDDTELCAPCFCDRATKVAECNIPYSALENVPKNKIPDYIVFLHLEGNEIKQVKNNALDNLSNLLSLWLQNNRIVQLEPNAFMGLKNLRLLDLRGNNLFDMPESVFQPTPFLTILFLEGNPLLSLQDNVLRNVPRLASLGFSDQVISNLTLGPGYRNLTQLEELYIGRSVRFIEMVTNGSFAALENGNLQKLSIANMTITHIESGALAPLAHSLKELRCIGMEYGIQSLNNLFFGLKNSKIKTIAVTETLSIQELRNDTFIPLNDTGLIELSLAENSIGALPAYAFSPLPKLQLLDLSSNTMSSIHPKAFFNLQSLLELRLNENRLQEVESEVFSLPSLHVLLIRWNYYPLQLQKNQFAHLANLLHLDLTRAILFAINRDSFSGLKNLLELNLDKNELKVIEDGAFDDLKKLRKLTLTECQIRSFPNGLFRNLVNLERLNLSQNGITKLPDFSQMRNLRFLYLTNNDIQKLSTRDFAGLVSLRELFLDGNKIQEWQGPVYTQLQMLETLVLTNNLIKRVTKQTALIPKSVKYLDVGKNPFECDCDLRWFVKWLNETDKHVNVIYWEGNTDYYQCMSPPGFENLPLQYFQLSDKRCSPSDAIGRREFLATIAGSLVLFSMLFSVCFSAVYYHRWHLRYLLFRLKARRGGYNRLDDEDRVDDNDYLWDACVTFAVEDEAWVFDNMIPRLENRETGLRLCIRDRDILYAQMTIMDAIVRTLCYSRRVILIVNAGFLIDKWCDYAMNIAQHRMWDENIDNIVVILTETVAMERMPPSLQNLVRHHACMETPTGEGQLHEQENIFWQTLVECLQSPVGRINDAEI